jgi:branched-chain amino acid aminotransferase
MIATEVGLGVRPTNKATYLLIATPAGAYFDPSKAVSVWISTEYVRAAQGGTGEAKCGGNYAASLVAQKAAAKEGCDQVVWIDAKERKWIEEMGGMNLYFVKGKGADATVITPKLTGTLLPGITRDSILSVAKDLGYKTEEVMLSIDDWREGVTSGEISEIFACGTAAVVSPVGQAKSAMGTWVTGDGQPGPITMQIRNHLLAIQHGTTEDKHGWVQKVAL